MFLGLLTHTFDDLQGKAEEMAFQSPTPELIEHFGASVATPSL